MPSLITHNAFGEELYHTFASIIPEGEEERNVFLLGNQGPDPLFYCVISPSLIKYANLGNTMHSQHPAQALQTLRQAVDYLNPEERSIGLAYALGFLGHWLLDSNEHPLIFYWEKALCNAGIDGLEPRDHSEVHAVIETELDERFLWTKYHKTIANFTPHKELLHASNESLAIIDKLFAYMALIVYETNIPAHMFTQCTHNFRLIQSAFHSPAGTKARIFAALERGARPHSFVRAMSHKNIEVEETPWENNTHAQWTNPWTNEVHNESFWDLWEKAQNHAPVLYGAFLSDKFDLAKSIEVTKKICFDGSLAD